MPTHYSFDNSLDQAQRRLRFLELVHDPGSILLLEKAFSSLPAGKVNRIWELGAGGGSIARWLMGRMAGEGQLILTDINTEPLQFMRSPRVQVIEQDVSLGMPPGQFDLIHARAVLCHIPQRNTILRQLLGKLTRSGALIIEEPDFFTCDVMPSVSGRARDLYRKCIDAIVRYQESCGMSYGFGRELFGLLQAEAVKIIVADSAYRIVCGGTPEAEFFSITYGQIESPVVSQGKINASDYANFLQLFADRGFSFTSHSMMSYWVTPAAMAP